MQNIFFQNAYDPPPPFPFKHLVVNILRCYATTFTLLLQIILYNVKKNARFVKWDIPYSKNINSFLWQDSPEPLFRAVDYDGDYDQLCHLGNVPAL